MVQMLALASGAVAPVRSEEYWLCLMAVLIGSYLYAEVLAY